jgi:uncharacterized membrane protein YkoI
MCNTRKWLTAAALAVVTALSVSLTLAADALTKEQVTKMALESHPGKVVKAYEETRKGQKVWEVQVKGDDGQQWELYYSMDGKLVDEKSK